MCLLLGNWAGLGFTHFDLEVISGIANRFHFLCQTSPGGSGYLRLLPQLSEKSAGIDY